MSTPVNVFAALLMVLPAFAWAATGATSAEREIADALAAGARQAQTICYRLVHDDTYEFGDCVRKLAQLPGQSAATRLGVEYFGWVGAMNSARLGMLGASDTAAEFLRRFRATQRTLRITDSALCASIPGDCATRSAVLKQAEVEK
jgi:hypothetical protein